MILSSGFVLKGASGQHCLVIFVVAVHFEIFAFGRFEILNDVILD
jgi:hypothetical protein